MHFRVVCSMASQGQMSKRESQNILVDRDLAITSRKKN